MLRREWNGRRSRERLSKSREEREVRVGLPLAWRVEIAAIGRERLNREAASADRAKQRGDSRLARGRSATRSNVAVGGLPPFATAPTAPPGGR
jgi:hypothetical protein